jgi:beta-lactamase regulating signal transducer with metallopeptidase domain
MSWVTEFGWLPLLFEYAVKSTVVLAFAMLLALLFRRSSASIRHFVLSLSLAGLLLLPVLSHLGLGWETGLLPPKADTANFAQAIPRADDETVRYAGGGDRGDEGLLSIGRAVALDKAVPDGLPRIKSSRTGLVFKSALPLIWSGGLIILLLRLAAGLFGAFRLTREGETVRDPRWRVLLERFLEAIHLRRRVHLKSHRDVLVPLTWGFLKPVILIPEGHELWTEEQRSSALVHELSHVKRADFLVMLLVRLSLAMFWFNPLSWVVLRRLKKDQEAACDERVLRAGIKPSTYAANLLFFKSTASSRLGYFAALVGLFGFGKTAFNERLTAILKQKWTFQEVKMRTRIMLSCAVILAVGLIGMARPAPSTTEEAEPGISVLYGNVPSVVEKTIVSEDRAVHEAEKTQEQSQTEETKAQKKKQQEQEQKEQFQAQERQEQQEQKQQFETQEKQAQKEKTEKAAVWTIKEGEKHKYQIKIQMGDEVKTIVIDKPIVIKEKDGKKVIFISPEGKEMKVLEGDPVHLEIIGDKLQFIKGGKVIKLGKDGSSFYVSVDPDVDITDITEAIRDVLKDIPDINKSVAIALKESTLETAKALAIAKPHITLVGVDEQKELREKLREVREKLKAFEENKLELSEVDEALADLEKDLEKMSQEMKTIGLKLEDKPVVYTITKKTGEAEAAAEVHVNIAEGAKKDAIKVVVSKDGMFKLQYRVDTGEKGREAYEKIVARVKKDLPESYTLDSEFDEGSGLVTLKISAPGDKETPKDLVKKITQSIQDEIKEKKE